MAASLALLCSSHLRGSQVSQDAKNAVQGLLTFSPSMRFSHEHIAGRWLQLAPLLPAQLGSQPVSQLVAQMALPMAAQLAAELRKKSY